jgi:tetratricopeptide (TPR) repeat protein
VVTDRDRRHIRVVAVSPNDVQGERDALERVIDELEEGIAGELGRRLSLWRWETDARPGLHLLGPQGLIDEQMRIEDADLVLGVFWKRFGTPTHDADSGTEHELRRAWESWRASQRPDVMVYFCERAYTPASPAEARQWAEVLEFQQQLPEEQMWWRYAEVADFERLARKHVTAYLRSLPSIVPQPRVAQLRLRFNVPRALADFVGREDELDAIDAALGVAGQVVVTQAITGLGGIGKSQLAARYVQQRTTGYDVVAWVGAQDGGVADLAALAGELGEQVEGLTPQERADRALHWLNHADERWLLVLDNLTSPSQLAGCCPHSGTGRVLVTTRHQGMAQFAPRLAVDVFDEDTATEYLVRRAGRPGDREGARRLARALGLLPLALSHAGAYCVAGTSFTEYLNLLSELPTQALFRASPETFYEQTIASTWQTSIAAANHDAPLASAVLELAAHLAPDAIPRSLFAVLVDGEDPAARMGVSDALNALHRFSLITIDNDSVGVHRLLQQTVRDRGTPDDRQHASAHAVAALRDAWSGAGDVALPVSWPRLELLLGHVLAIARTAIGSGEQLVALLIAAGLYLLHAGGGLRAITVNERAAGDAERILGPEHPDTLMAHANLATSYRSAGRTSDALELLEQVLADRERILGPEHPDTLTARANLATSYWSAGRTSDALELREQVLAEYERILGPEHPDTLTARANLAASYWSAGRTSDALELDEQVLADRERILGPEHPDTLMARANLAALRTAGTTDAKDEPESAETS